MKNKILLLLRYINRFGIKGLYIYFSRTYLGSIRLSNQEIKLRKNTSDADTFDQVFIEQNYKLQINHPKLIIDAGANVGISTFYFKTLFPNAAIICIEPEEDNFILLKKNLKYKNAKIDPNM